MPKELEKIIGGFQMVGLALIISKVCMLGLCKSDYFNELRQLCKQVPDPKIKYQQLLFYAKKLKPMAAALHTETNKVQGCVSQASC